MKTISEIFKKGNSKLGKLLNKTTGSENLDLIFRTSIDENLAKNCSFASYKDSTLTIIVPNASWATKLRYAIPDIKKNLKIQPEFKDLTNIRYTVVTPNKKATKKKKIPAKMSKENEQLWQKTMDDLKKTSKS